VSRSAPGAREAPIGPFGGRRATETTDALVIGAGPAGLAAAIELKRLGIASVAVIDREDQAGGIPRHSAHLGFGMRDMRRLLSGPRYAERYVALARGNGVDLRTSTTVTGWDGPTTVETTSPSGIARLAARSVLLATGCRERPRSARLVPGTRPAGVFTTGTLQQLVYLQGIRAGRRAVVVGAEHVSFSAVLTLAHGGAATLAMVTEHACPQSFRLLEWIAARRLRVPILTGSRLVEIRGGSRVEGVAIADRTGGQLREIACDTVVFTGDWVPDSELARRLGLEMDPGTRAPRVDLGLRTSMRGVFAAGNLVHAAETADVAALGGRHAARSMHSFLTTGDWPPGEGVPLVAQPPLRWVSPNTVRLTRERIAHGELILRVAEVQSDVDLVVEQDGRTLWRQHRRTLLPNRTLRAAAAWLGDVDLGGGPIRLGLEAPARRGSSP